MADVHSTEVRSYNMSRIKNSNTGPEMLVRRYLHAHGFRYRLHAKDLPGKPDIVLPRLRTVVMVHGCFWHRHKCRAGRSTPTSNQQFWLRKFRENRSRDRRQCKALREMGYQVFVIWECQTKPSARNALANRLTRMLGRVGLSKRGRIIQASP